MMPGVNIDKLKKYVSKYRQSKNVLAIILRSFSYEAKMMEFIVYVDNLDIVEQHKILSYEDGYLICVNYQSLAEHDEASKKVTEAAKIAFIWESHILYDPQGLMKKRAKYRDELSSLTLEQYQQYLQEARHVFSHQVYELAEIVHKILGDLKTNSWSTLIQAAPKLAEDLGTAITLQRIGVNYAWISPHFLLENEMEELWWHNFLVAVGKELPKDSGDVARMRGLAALKLYLDTVKLFSHKFENQHRTVIETAAKFIENYLVEENNK